MIQEIIYKAILADTGQVLADRVIIADTPVTRIRGLLGKASLGAGEGLFITSCSSIHTFFMKFPIDAVFLRKNGTIIKVSSNIKPWRLRGCLFGCDSVLELNAGTICNAADLTKKQLKLVKI